MPDTLPELPEPLFLLHTGSLFGNERDDWETEARGQAAVDALCETSPLGMTIGLHDEATVRRLLAECRRQALEEAARVCESLKTGTLAARSADSDDLANVMLRQVAVLGHGQAADAIRALKDKP